MPLRCGEEPWTLPRSMHNIRNPGYVRDAAVRHYINQEEEELVQPVRDQSVRGRTVRKFEVQDIELTRGEQYMYSGERDLMARRWAKLLTLSPGDKRKLVSLAEELHEASCRRLAEALGACAVQ